MIGRLRAGLQAKLLATHLLVLAVGAATLFLTISVVAPEYFDQLMVEVAGPQMRALGHEMTPQAQGAMKQLTAVAFREAVVISLAWAGGAAMIAAIVVGAFVSGRIVTPVRRMASAARRIAAGRYAERVPRGEPDELGELADSFNEMAKSLESDERRRQDLIGNIAHELRTPIATIQGYLEGVLDGIIEPNPKTWTLLLSETGRLRRLVDDLQELSRAEARQLSLSIRAVDPARLVEVAAARLGNQFEEKGLRLDTVVSEGTSHVLADEDRSVQVLTNLLSNALRYSPAGSDVTVSVRQQDGDVLFQVRDSGIGIASEHLPHLFERFYRVDRARSRAAGGSGIGLTIARSLVEAMGGRIWAESAGPDRGATFFFTLPTTQRAGERNKR